MTRPHDTEIVLGQVLTFGTRLSTALLVLGLLGTLLSRAGGGALLSAGLVVLMATPMARVAVSVVEFARSREWWFVLCTMFVLSLLLGSLIVALRG